MAGVSPVSVDKAVQELCRIRLANEPLLQRKMVNEGSRRFYLYEVAFIRKSMMQQWKGRFFPFYRCLIDSGVWADLKPRAKALYLVLRQFAKFDFELYCEIEDLYLDPIDRREAYRLRKWEVVHGHSLAELCDLVDIESSDIQSTLIRLTEHRLVDRVGSDFMIYLKTHDR
jgi:hypothetical protein